MSLIQKPFFNTANWVGKVGAVRVKHEDYNGNASAKVQYFIRADKRESLPAWVEPQRKDSAAPATASQTPTDVWMEAGGGEDAPF